MKGIIVEVDETIPLTPYQTCEELFFLNFCFSEGILATTFVPQGFYGKPPAGCASCTMSTSIATVRDCLKMKKLNVAC
jgi:hypothetical protein